MPIAKEKSQRANKVKHVDTKKDAPAVQLTAEQEAALEEKKIAKQKQKQLDLLKGKTLIASAEYKPEGWFAVVSFDGAKEDVYAELAANETSAYDAAIAEVQRLKIVEDGFGSTVEDSNSVKQ